MDHPLRRPEEILAYRSLRQILAGKPKVLWPVGSKDNALSAMHLMAEKTSDWSWSWKREQSSASSRNGIVCGAWCLPENLPFIGVISIRDLLSEAVAHHEKVIGELERERLTMLTSTA